MPHLFDQLKHQAQDSVAYLRADIDQHRPVGEVFNHLRGDFERGQQTVLASYQQERGQFSSHHHIMGAQPSRMVWPPKIKSMEPLGEVVDSTLNPLRAHISPSE